MFVVKVTHEINEHYSLVKMMIPQYSYTSHSYTAEEL
jgi:hypothetical protein